LASFELGAELVKGIQSAGLAAAIKHHELHEQAPVERLGLAFTGGAVFSDINRVAKLAFAFSLVCGLLTL
jgi:hypothetical protein